MITQDTASRIWNCYREIEVAKSLLEDMDKAAKDSFHIPDKNAPTLKDAFGQVRHLQLGIPSGEGSHRLFRVMPQLAKSVINAHIAAINAELVEANEQARIELDGLDI